jgi:ankyrin repeat protein
MKKGDAETAKLDFAQLIEAELERDPQSCALIAAARAGNHRLCTVALQYGDSVDAQDSAGNTALHIAIDSKQHDLALFLLSRQGPTRLIHSPRLHRTRLKTIAEAVPPSRAVTTPTPFSRTACG